MKMYAVITKNIQQVLLFCLVLFFSISLPGTVVASTCSNVKWLNTDHSNFLWSIVGEWRILRCTTFDNENVNTTLWIDQTRPVIIDGVKIREISKNVYNLTNLQLKDTASYYCKACDSFKNLLRVNVKKGIAFAKPSITRPDNPITYGSNVLLKCYLHGSLYDYDMRWFKLLPNGQEIEMPSVKSVKWSPNPAKNQQSALLNIKNFTSIEEKYFCQLKRYTVRHSSRTNAYLKLQSLFTPSVSIQTRDGHLEGIEGKEYFVNYNVTGTPPPRVIWYRYAGGRKEKLSECSTQTRSCEGPSSENISVTISNFTIKNAKFSRDNNVTYICEARNAKGTTIQGFTPLIKTKPNLMRPTSEIQLYKKDLFLQCSPLKDVNRKGMTFSWAYCDIDKVSKKGSTSACEKEKNWKDLHSSSGNALAIQSNQTAGIRLYRCRSKNDMGSDEIIWKIVIPLDDAIPIEICNKLFVKGVDKTGVDGFDSVKIWQGATAFLILLLLFTLFITYHRRNSLIHINNFRMTREKIIGHGV
ncbi:immunoglobulin superfamily member 10-like [Xenia sp. Carnegie-2017]|uniref:immunoglobulin superfamily member 10-like n=1 Tax=Xenia sp. Carnegie-2017 TaxID=2897299 RepID=UPI001F04243A|nr:immunoglobulin superfamily member 10-like [Xenia sp. Carnegie-2017]